MMRSRAWVALLLLLPAVLLERFAYYGARAILAIHLQSVQLSVTESIQLFSITTSLTYLAAVAGGGLAFGIGPRPTAILGSLVTALGLVLTTQPATPRAGVVIMMLGAGLFRPC